MIVKRNKNNVTQICGLWIRPGVNEIPDKMEDMIRNDRQFKHELKNGSMVIMSAPKLETPATPVETLAEEEAPDMNSKDMIAMVRETFDIPLLKRWRSGENRKTVIEAIDTQIERLSEDDK